jgi:hypothetical protein
MIVAGFQRVAGSLFAPMGTASSARGTLARLSSPGSGSARKARMRRRTRAPPFGFHSRSPPWPVRANVPDTLLGQRSDPASPAETKLPSG